MTEQSIGDLHKQLEKHGQALDRQAEKLETIQQTLQKIAVQDEQIRQMQSEQQALWHKWDNLAGADGLISEMQKYQASCPRKQIQYIWWVIIPMAISQLGLAAKIVDTMIAASGTG